jgi:hypothetical protein
MEEYGDQMDPLPMKDIHKATWVALDGQTTNQIYHTLTDRRQATCIINVRTH